MGAANCEICDQVFTFDVIPRRGKVCFRCHVKGVNLGFRGGKDHFHDLTIRERQSEIERGAANQGREIERLPEKAWV